MASILTKSYIRFHQSQGWLTCISTCHVMDILDLSLSSLLLSRVRLKVNENESKVCASSQCTLFPTSLLINHMTNPPYLPSRAHLNLCRFQETELSTRAFCSVKRGRIHINGSLPRPWTAVLHESVAEPLGPSATPYWMFGHLTPALVSPSPDSD